MTLCTTLLDLYREATVGQFFLCNPWAIFYGGYNSNPTEFAPNTSNIDHKPAFSLRALAVTRGVFSPFFESGRGGRPLGLPVKWQGVSEYGLNPHNPVAIA